MAPSTIQAALSGSKGRLGTGCSELSHALDVLRASIHTRSPSRFALLIPEEDVRDSSVRRLGWTLWIPIFGQPLAHLIDGTTVVLRF